MKKWRILAYIAVVALALSGCTKDKVEDTSEETATTVATSIATTEEQTEVATTLDFAQHYDPIEVETVEINEEESSLTLEAEEATIPEGCSVVVVPRLGYSGQGYISGLDSNNESTLKLSADIEATQHYDITVVAASDTEATCKLAVDGNVIHTISSDGSTDNFVKITIPCVFLEEGTHEISITASEGKMDIDCVQLENDNSMSDSETETPEELVNPNASEGAQKLFSFLQEHYGSEIISGQYVTKDGNEITHIYNITGKSPLIRFADMGAYSNNPIEDGDDTVIDESIEWAEQGGIVGLSWYWSAPTGQPTLYASDATFDLSDAITYEDITNASEEELLTMYQNSTISESTYKLMLDIDAIAEAMQPLTDADIPVLWRPMPEAGGAWYWWGASGGEAFSWLWDTMYARMTYYYNMNNLIWVWNGQSSDYTINRNEYDIAAMDLYVDEDEEFGSRYEQYASLKNTVTTKFLAISECSSLPDVNALFRDNSVWSFFGMWYDPYLSENASDQDLIATYNSTGVLTLGDYE